MLEIWDLLLKWAYDQDFVDEENALFLVFNALCNGLPLMVEGSTGSGKSRALDLVFDLIPEEWVLTVHSDTEAATVRVDFTKNGKYKYMHIPEYQKFACHPGNIEMLKTIMEGKDYTKTVMVGKVRTPWTVPKEIVPVMSVAYGNAHDNRDAEFNRRVASIHLRVDPDHIATVIRSNQKRKKFAAKYHIMTTEENERLKNIVQMLIQARPETFVMSNPFQEFIANRYIDKGVIRGTATSSHINTYSRFAEGFAKLRLMSLPDLERMATCITEQSGDIKQQSYLMTLQDVVINEIVFGKDLYRNIMGIPYLGEEILQMFDDKELANGNSMFTDYGDMKGDVRLTLRKVCKGLEKKGYIIDEEYVRGALEDMEKNFHVTSDPGNIVTKQCTRVKRTMPEVTFEREDWIECWRVGLKEALVDSDKNEVKRWVNAQTDTNGHITFDNPLTKEKDLLVKKKEVWK